MTTKLTTNVLTTVLLGLFTLVHRSDGDFLNTASQANLAEIASGRLASKLADEPRIRAFADSVVADHEQAESELEGIAHQENITLAHSPDTEHQQSMARLANLAGGKFDSTYMNMQQLDHQVAIQLFQQESNVGRDSLARMYAKKYLPNLRHHLEMAKELAIK